MGPLLVIAYIAIGIAQMWAGMVGMHLYFGIGGFLAVIIFFVAYSIPVIGTAAVAFMAYYGARYGWDWEWWQALLLAVPGIVLMIVGMLAVGLESLFGRNS